MNDFYNQLPDPEQLIRKHTPGKDVPQVNGHLHTPYSFCSFDNIPQMFEMAAAEHVVVLGINDFFAVDGYSEFEKNALQKKIFPLFNIEFMGLMKDLQENDIRVNDTNNPGRIYFSGKALEHPLNISGQNRDFLENLQANSQLQVREMCVKTNHLLKEIQAPFGISFDQVREKYAENLVRERHIARAIREAVFGTFSSDTEKKAFFEKLFGGKIIGSSLNDIAGVENEIRSVILKKGGRAFVPEEGDAFPDLQRIIDFIIDAGGIPCYPVLLDDRDGEITVFERDWDRMDESLKSYGVSCLELIPQRNSLKKLQEFVAYFDQRKYVISFGTEHNAPELFPVTVQVEKDKELTPELREISYRGTCVLAAHQYLIARKENGFIDYDGKADLENLDYFRELGHAVITDFTSIKK